MDFLRRFGNDPDDNNNNNNNNNNNKFNDSTGFGFGLEKSRSKSVITTTTEELELSLDLSTNGCFGVDLKGKTKLIRSSSIASILPLPKTEIVEEVAVPPAAAATGSLARTTSLPVESEEAVRKRKEMQFLKRLEVKRKRLERRNSMKSGGIGLKEKSSECIDFGMINSCLNNGIGGSGGIVNGFSSFSVKAVSLGSQGSCCSAGTSEIEAKSMQVTDSKSNTQSEANGITPTPTPSSNQLGRTSSMVDEMPCVSTRGENGRTIEGFLYNFRKGGAEVRIVCVCHGTFLTPAEFVKHAGGGDVTNPLRHITVNPSGFL